MTVTRNKAQKAATRQRMAETGEPYSVARKATQARAEDPGFGETPEQRYVREAQEAGVSGTVLEALRAAVQTGTRWPATAGC
jgi:hypothetical protein